MGTSDTPQEEQRSHTATSNDEWPTQSSILNLTRQRQHLIDELISSEIKYISYLKNILKSFADPLGNSLLLPPDMHAEIFGRLAPIICVNETLLESTLIMGIEEAFLIIAPCLKLYADYARRYQMILVLLETCITFSTELSRFIFEQENLPEVNLQLHALLIMPIQRIPRYALLLQELLSVSFQLDGFTAKEAFQSVNDVVMLSHKPHVIPEQVSSSIIARYANNSRNEQRTSRASFLGSPGFTVIGDWSQIDRFAFRASLPTVQLMAALAGITATATYLNEQIRLNDQADMAALLQSKLLGRWTRNLLLVPGRRLLRYGLVYKINELNGRRQPRLFVLLSDILIYATPQKRHPFKSTMHNRNRYQQHIHKKRSQVTPKSTPRRSIPSARVPRSSFLFRRRPKHGFTYPPFERAWLESVARPSSPSIRQSPIDLLTSKNVRFSCISVYPLHHCQIEPHFATQRSDAVMRSFSHLTFIDEHPVARSPECCTQLTFSMDADQTLTNQSTCYTDTRIIANQDTPMSLDLGCLSRDRNAFTVRCREASFTVAVDDRDTAEDWVLSLDTAINAVRMARQSLRKASSAKRPMSVADFVSYERWLQQAERQTQGPASSHGNKVAETLGLHETDLLSDWSESRRALLNRIRRFSLPFPAWRDSRKAYMISQTDCGVPKPSLSCLRSKSCSSILHCFPNGESGCLAYSAPSNQSAVRLMSVRANPSTEIVFDSCYSGSNNNNSYLSFDECSPTFSSLPQPRISAEINTPTQSIHSPDVTSFAYSNGIASCSTNRQNSYSSVSDNNNHSLKEQVSVDSKKSSRRLSSSRCSIM